MTNTATGRSKEPPTKLTRPQRVIRLSKLPQYLGVEKSIIRTMIAEGRLVPFNLSGGRSKVVFESEVIELQKKAHAEAKAARKREQRDEV
jgi:hypothetical protein